MKKKGNIFIDFDITMCDTLPIHIAYMNQRWGIQSCAEDYKHHPPLHEVVLKYRPEETGLITDAIVYEDITLNFLNSIEWHESIVPSEGLCEVVPRLAEEYNLYIATAREKGTTPVIERFVDTYIQNCITDIHCVCTYLGNGQFSKVSKRDFIASSRGRNIALIDDSVKENLEAKDIVNVYLYDPHGNHANVSELSNKVQNWYNFEAMIKS